MLKLRQLLNIFKGGQKPPTKEDTEKLKEKLFVKVARLKKLKANPDFKEYISLIEEYIDQCRLQKLRYNFAHALMIQDKKTFRHAAFLDNDIDFAQKLFGIHDNLIRDVEEMEKQEKEKESEAEE